MDKWKIIKIKQKPVTEEVKKWSIDFMRSVETEGYESMVGKLNELTPELRLGVLDYLKRITDYCVKHNMNDFLEGVNTYKELIGSDNKRKLTDCSKLEKKLSYKRKGNRGSVYKKIVRQKVG